MADSWREREVILSLASMPLLWAVCLQLVSAVQVMVALADRNLAPPIYPLSLTGHDHSNIVSVVAATASPFSSVGELGGMFLHARHRLRTSLLQKALHQFSMYT